MEAGALLAAFTLAALRRSAVLAGEGTGTSRDAREGGQVPPVASRLLSGGPPRRRQALYLSGGEFQSLDQTENQFTQRFCGCGHTVGSKTS